MTENNQPNKDLVPRQANAVKITQKEQKTDVSEIRLKAANASIDAAADLVKLLVRGGNVFLDVQEMQNQAAKGWQETRQRIELLDAESKAEILKLETQLKPAKDKTERLGMVLNLIATKGETLSETYAASLGKAVEQLTKD